MNLWQLIVATILLLIQKFRNIISWDAVFICTMLCLISYFLLNKADAIIKQLEEEKK